MSDKKEEENKLVEVKVINADSIPKYQTQISIAVFCGVIAVIASGIFLILSEYFTIKSSIEKINYTLSDMKEDQSELEDVIENGKFKRTPENDLAYEVNYKELDCDLILKKMEHLKKVSEEKKCK